jgi:hypothetical protein
VQPASEYPSPDKVDANNILSSLLDRLESVLADVRSSTGAKPFFVVEAELGLQLRRAIPGVRFLADDIRRWAAEISS